LRHNPKTPRIRIRSQEKLIPRNLLSFHVLVAGTSTVQVARQYSLFSVLITPTSPSTAIEAADGTAATPHSTLSSSRTFCGYYYRDGSRQRCRAGCAAHCEGFACISLTLDRRVYEVPQLIREYRRCLAHLMLRGS